MIEQPAPFFLIVSDLEQRFFCVEGPMTDDRPWINAARHARDQLHRRVLCGPAGADRHAVDELVALEGGFIDRFDHLDEIAIGEGISPWNFTAQKNLPVFRRAASCGPRGAVAASRSAYERPNVLAAWRRLVPLPLARRRKVFEAASMTKQLPAIIDGTEIIGDVRAHVVPALIAAAGERASLRFLAFFAANIRNPHTRRAYSRAVAEFMTWCEDNGMTSITAVQPLHVSAWIEQQTREHEWRARFDNGYSISRRT